jgi:hypothetical protein
MRLSRLAITIATAFTIGAGPAITQAQEPGSELTVYLLTIGEGDFIYERFGHNAIWIHDAANGSSLAYNWGMFDDDQPGFIRNFLMGRMMYWMQPITMDQTLYAYQSSNRSVWAQELNLSNAQKKSLQQFVEINARDENKFYRYDYYRDNCSTRVRDALDLALSGELKRTLQPRAAHATYRSETRRLMLADIPTLTGMNLAMGPRIDQPLSAWDESFIPMELREWVREVRVSDAAGIEQPLVKSERTLFQAARNESPERPPDFTRWYLLAGVGGAALFLLLGSIPARWGRITSGVLMAVWSLLIGLLGTLIAGLWAFTDHAVTYQNENVLQANPLSLLLVLALLGLALHTRWAARLAARVSLVVAGLSVLGLLIQVMPAFDQSNSDIIALLLPAHLAVAAVLTGWLRRPAR